MIRKSRVVLIMAIVGLAIAIGLSWGFVAPTVQADHISMFDMNDRNASKEIAGSGSGVAVVNGSNIDFMIVAKDLSALELYQVIVTVRKKGDPMTDSVVAITYEVITDAEGQLSFEKSNFNLDLLPPGEWRVDYAIADPKATDPGRTDAGKGFTAKMGLDPLLTCQPATILTVGE